jgi:hypothetical protein
MPVVRLVTAAWTAWALAVTRRRLRRGGIERVRVPRPPLLPARATSVVDRVLRRLGATCLERSLVRQSWLAAHGTRADVVIGVTGLADFDAHAWLEGEPDSLAPAYHELKRIAPS